MTTLHPSLAGIRGIVLDLDGVLYEDEAPVPGAAETVAALDALGLPFRFLTNTTSKSRAAIASKLTRFGLAATAAQIFSPGYAAAQYLREHGMSAHLLVQPGALQEFDSVRRSDDSPDAVVVGDLADAWSYEHLNRAFRLVHERGARLIGLGRSMYWRSARGLLLDVGPFLAALESATGQRALVFGKPERAIFDAAIEDLKLAAPHVAMIGDDLEVDVLPAQQAGLRGVLVRTGKFRESDLHGDARPDLVLNSVADVIGSSAEK